MKKTLTTTLAVLGLFFGNNINAQCIADVNIGQDINGQITFTDNSTYSSSTADMSTTLTVRQAGFGVGMPQDMFTQTEQMLPTGNSATVTFPFNHYFMLTYTITDNNTGCTDEISKNFIVQNKPTSCTANYSFTETEGHIDINNLTTGTTGGEFVDIQLKHPSLLNTRSILLDVNDTPIHTDHLVLPGTWDVSFLVTDFDGCSSFKIGTIDVDTLDCGVLDFEAEENGNSMSFTPNIIGTGYTYTYDFGNGSPTVSSPFGVGFTYPSNGTFNVCVTRDNGNGCTDQLCEQITVTNALCFTNLNVWQDSLNPNTFYGEHNSSAINPQYSWDFGDGSPNSTEEYPTHQYAQPGSYTICLTITGDGGCSETDCQNVTYTQKASGGFFFQVIPEGETADVTKLEVENHFKIFPNPTNGSTNISSEVMIDAYQIMDMNGRIIDQVMNVKSLEAKVDLTLLQTGIYLITVMDINGNTSAPQKIIKQ